MQQENYNVSMDSSVYKSMCESIRRAFGGLPDKDPIGMAPVTLAYIGDTVYDLFVRTYAVHKTGYTADRLHKFAVSLVRASSQARAFHVIEPHLTEEETRIFKRGRNSHSTVPKSASQADYRTATGLEALFGYLFLHGEDDRLASLMSMILENTDESMKEA